MARRFEDVRPYWAREAEEAQEWRPTPEQQAEWDVALAAHARGEDEGMPLEDFEPIILGWIAECAVEAGGDGEP